MNSTGLLARSSVLDLVTWPSADARAWVSGFVDRAEDSPGLAAIVAYGSAVRGTTANDVDLLVVGSGGSRPQDAPMDVDLRWIDARDVDALVAGGDEVLGWALRLGVPLFDRGGFWQALASAWEGRLPLPSADAAEERARRAAVAADGLRSGGDDDAADELLLTSLTQRARSLLLRAGIFPFSRPELPGQLLQLGELQLARRLSALLPTRV